MIETTALVAVVSGQRYYEFADAMFETAEDHFNPTEKVTFHQFHGREGPWPAGTMYRYHVLAKALRTLPCDFVFLIDADALFEEAVGSEILPPANSNGITATLHPGYVNTPGHQLPFERRAVSHACVPHHEGRSYFCGGFIGGTREAMRILSFQVAAMVDADAEIGVTPTWHDESCANRVLTSSPPAVTLDPSYCHPDADAYYVDHIWGGQYPRRIVMLDKDAETRGDR